MTRTISQAVHLPAWATTLASIGSEDMAEQQRIAQYVSECVGKAVNIVLSARAASGSGSMVREGRRSWVRQHLLSM